MELRPNNATYELVDVSGSGNSVMVKAKVGAIRCIDIPCQHCPMKGLYKLCQKQKLLDPIIESKDLIQELSTSSKRKGKYLKALSLYNRTITFRLAMQVYEDPANWKAAPFPDVHNHILPSTGCYYYNKDKAFEKECEKDEKGLSF